MAVRPTASTVIPAHRSVRSALSTRNAHDERGGHDEIYSVADLKAGPGDRTFERDGGEHYPPFTTPMVFLSQDVVFPLLFDTLCRLS